VKIIHVLEPFASGVTTAVISITKELRDFQHIVVHGSRMWVDTIDNVKSKFPSSVVFIPWKYAGREISPVKDFLALFSLLGILKGQVNGQTVVHLHSSKAGFLGRLAAFILGIKKVVYTPHGASFTRTDVGPLARSFFRFLERVGGLLGGTVVGCGKTEAELYRDLEKGREAIWVYNGVERSSLQKVLEPDLVVFTGIANQQKDPALFNAIAGSFPRRSFYWIGDGPLKGELNSPNIICTGWVDKALMTAYLARAAVYLSASAWEGLPFGVLEAMDASCALLLRDVPGNRDLVIPGENGYLFTGAEEAKKLLAGMLEDRKKTLDMGKKSGELAASVYSAEAMGKAYKKIYTSLMETGKVNAPY
jgi:glycosyltransferase involved in cell wall biosynthesis